ncbi:MAG: hypothetical protein ACP5VS_13060 [Desulfomonilaceae bacterium]
MEIYNSEDIRLFPGQAVKALTRASNKDSQKIGFFIRSTDNGANNQGLESVQQRAGLVKFKNVLLVLTIIKINNDDHEIFDVWWNYHAPDGPSLFHKMSEQENIIFNLCDDHGVFCFFEAPNEFRKFFEYLSRVLDHAKSWTEVEFDRAVTGFCAQHYPKSALWNMIQSDLLNTEIDKKRDFTVNDYPGYIPADLKDFYVYKSDKGHCIRIIPSNREAEVAHGIIEEMLEAAPIKTVLRCGFRWLKGYPVAPIPFIPGHGLATPPDDCEF